MSGFRRKRSVDGEGSDSSILHCYTMVRKRSDCLIGAQYRLDPAKIDYLEGCKRTVVPSVVVFAMASTNQTSNKEPETDMSPKTEH